jgi:thiol-disulfide isomerase/thioredoxin
VPPAAELRRRIEAALRLSEGSQAGAAEPIPPRTLRTLKKTFLGLALAALPAVLGVKAWEIWVERPRVADEAFDIARTDARAPDLQLQTADGRTFALSAYRGQVVFVNFWATWCPPCRDELPSMLALGRALEARHPGRFKMLAVSVDDGWEVVREFFGGAPPPGLTVALDTEQLTTRAWYCAARGACPESYKFPESYIVDKGGRLVAYVVGPRDWSDPSARRFLEQLIGS